MATHENLKWMSRNKSKSLATHEKLISMSRDDNLHKFVWLELIQTYYTPHDRNLVLNFTCQEHNILALDHNVHSIRFKWNY